MASMKTALSFLALGAVLAAPAALPAKIVRTVEQTFPVSPGGQLRAATQGGDITIHTADTPEVRVIARQTIKADTDAQADELLRRLTLTLEPQGDTIVAEARYDTAGTGWIRRGNAVTVAFEITVPRHFNLELTTSGGDIAVADIEGRVRARTSGGDLTFARVDGDLDGDTSGGDIRLAEGTARAKLHTSGGDITIARAGGPTEVSTSGGDIRLDSVAELISATTSGGDITAVLAGDLRHDSLLSTSGGDVRVRLAPTIGFRLDARTSGGDVRAAGLTLTIADGALGKSKLVGTVNGGGPLLKLRSSGGDISLRPVAE